MSVLAAWRAWDAAPSSPERVEALEHALSAAHAPSGARDAVNALRRGGMSLEGAVGLILPAPAAEGAHLDAQQQAPENEAGCAHPGPPAAPERPGEQNADVEAHKPGGHASRLRVVRSGSARYVSFATDGQVLAGPNRNQITALDRDVVHANQLAAAARVLAPAGELLIWVHPSAPWDLTVDAENVPEFCAGARAQGSWCRLDVPGPPVLVGPATSGDFGAAVDVAELHHAVVRFAEALGIAYVYSGGSTGHALIRTSQGRRRLSNPFPHPELGAPSTSAWATPAHAWCRPPTLAERSQLGHVRAYDRNGGYLAAWSGLNLGDGPWEHHRDVRLDADGETRKPAGYWLVDPEPVVPFFLADSPGLPALPDPFARRGVDRGPRWLTTPLAQLAGEMAAAAGVELVAEEVWWTAETIRALDGAARSLSRARDLLADCPAALNALKGCYARAVAWFGEVDGSLGRPDWRNAVIDRHVANLWRSTCRTVQPTPLALSDVDTVYFATDGHGHPPAGLRVGTNLGAFKTAGPPVLLTVLVDHLDAGEPGAFVKAYRKAAGE